MGYAPPELSVEQQVTREVFRERARKARRDMLDIVLDDIKIGGSGIYIESLLLAIVGICEFSQDCLKYEWTAEGLDELFALKPWNQGVFFNEALIKVCSEAALETFVVDGFFSLLEATYNAYEESKERDRPRRELLKLGPYCCPQEENNIVNATKELRDYISTYAYPISHDSETEHYRAIFRNWASNSRKEISLLALELEEACFGVSSGN